MDLVIYVMEILNQFSFLKSGIQYLLFSNVCHQNPKVGLVLRTKSVADSWFKNSFNIIQAEGVRYLFFRYWEQDRDILYMHSHIYLFTGPLFFVGCFSVAVGMAVVYYYSGK